MDGGLIRGALSVAAGVGLALLWSQSCAPRTPVPPLGPHTSADNPVMVSSMPEPVQVETLPDWPGGDAVWVDGSWIWRGRRWEWKSGSWQRPPPGGYYARPTFVRLPVEVTNETDGGVRSVGYGMRLMYIPGHWHVADGGTWEPDGEVSK